MHHYLVFLWLMFLNYYISTTLLLFYYFVFLIIQLFHCWKESQWMSIVIFSLYMHIYIHIHVYSWEFLVNIHLISYIILNIMQSIVGIIIIKNGRMLLIIFCNLLYNRYTYTSPSLHSPNMQYIHHIHHCLVLI